MSDAQLSHFRDLLLQERSVLIDFGLSSAVVEIEHCADPIDSAALALDHQTSSIGEARRLMRLREIEQALLRITSGEYGFCEASGEEIGLKRLLANPAARLSLEAQSRQELHQRFKKGSS